MSERAYRLIDEVYREIFPYIEEEVSKELVDFPTFRAVRGVRVGPRTVSGYTDADEKTITIATEDVDRLFEMGYPEPFVKHVITSAFFHELRHYKDLMKMTPAEREEFKRKYVEDPEYHAEFEREAAAYGLKWAREVEEIKLRREIEKLTEELREALRGESAHPSPQPKGEEDLERRVSSLTVPAPPASSGNLDPKKIAYKIRDELEKQGIRPIEIGLFGSRATTEAKPESDWDFYAWIDPEMWRRLSETPTAIPELSELMKIQNSIGITVSPEHPFGITCTFGPDRSKCVDFKLAPERPPTGKPILTDPSKLPPRGTGLITGRKEEDLERRVRELFEEESEEAGKECSSSEVERVPPKTARELQPRRMRAGNLVITSGDRIVETVDEAERIAPVATPLHLNRKMAVPHKILYHGTERWKADRILKEGFKVMPPRWAGDREAIWFTGDFYRTLHYGETTLAVDPSDIPLNPLVDVYSAGVALTWYSTTPIPPTKIIDIYDFDSLRDGWVSRKTGAFIPYREILAILDEPPIIVDPPPEKPPSGEITEEEAREILEDYEEMREALKGG